VEIGEENGAIASDSICLSDLTLSQIIHLFPSKPRISNNPTFPREQSSCNVPPKGTSQYFLAIQKMATSDFTNLLDMDRLFISFLEGC
jgi:hypothetical protein